MGIREMKRALKAEVRAERNQERFDAAKQHQPELLEHETMLSVLKLLGAKSKVPYAEKEALTRALLREYQREPHPFWTGILFVAYYPMLALLRGRILGDTIHPDDLDQIVISAFFEVVSDFPLSGRQGRTCMFLRQMTQREAFKRVRAEQRKVDHERPYDPASISRVQSNLEALGLPARWPETKPTRERRPDRTEGAAQVSFLAEHAGDLLDANKLDLVVATLVRRETLRAYADRVHPGESRVGRRRAYERIKRRRSRTIARMRQALGELRGDFAGVQSSLVPAELALHLGLV